MWCRVHFSLHAKIVPEARCSLLELATQQALRCGSLQQSLAPVSASNTAQLFKHTCHHESELIWMHGQHLHLHAELSAPLDMHDVA